MPRAVPAQEMQYSWWTFPTATRGNTLQNKWGYEFGELVLLKKKLPERAKRAAIQTTLGQGFVCLAGLQGFTVFYSG